ncbi:hypothetical protein G6O69_28780 [Pseudenhygromyxa sp. WMMC2535]|uniref:hypothetical protein n=1 Tax=Pseudenhygromyxa sp. WMMC2535 TaxID=2712867 RepID=UPI0015518427|nr:hypothetical protein [Pseudenhygromyxa sp. WMMC2535]NVB41862.1 hypothetical protein [Pseudenhygromyxa sp. WMMC2535]
MRRQLALLAAISMALGLTACTKIKSRDLIREGNQLYRDAQFEDAIAKYNESLELEPGGVTVQWNRAMAAESIVLALKDATNEEAIAKRKEYATLALEALDAWNETRDKPVGVDEQPACAKPKVEEEEAPAEGEDAEGEAAEGEAEKPNTDPEAAAYREHRLALLGADARCDDLIEHWRQMHLACPQNEDLYMTIAQTFDDICGKPEKAEEWYVKRTEDFPESAKAWYTLATRRFSPLFPDAESGMPFNAAVDADRRIEIADEVIKMLEKATALEPKYRDPYVWRSMAYTQKSLAREYIEPPETTEDAILAILARRDLMLAWRETKAVCDIDKIPECPANPEPGALFQELEADPTSWMERELTIIGHVIDETVKEVDADNHVWDLDIEVEYEPPLPDGEEPPPPPPTEVEGEEPPPLPKKIVSIRYTFLKPAVAEGEEAPDISEAVLAQVDLWKRMKYTTFTGFISVDGDDLVLKSDQKQVVACCPEAPLTPEAEKSDADHLEELYAQKKAEEDAASAEGDKGKKGKRK